MAPSEPNSREDEKTMISSPEMTEVAPTPRASVPSTEVLNASGWSSTASLPGARSTSTTTIGIDNHSSAASSSSSKDEKTEKSHHHQHATIPAITQDKGAGTKSKPTAVSVDDINLLSGIRNPTSDSPWLMISNTIKRIRASAGRPPGQPTPVTKAKKLPFLSEMDDATFEKLYENAKTEQERNQPGRAGRTVWMVGYFLGVLVIAYFAFVGWPFWDGIIFSFWKFTHMIHGVGLFGTGAFILWPSLFIWIPLLTTRFDGHDQPLPPDVEARDVSDTCLVIACYKSADILRRSTLPCALKIFRPEQILVVANGNSETPLDKTEDVCKAMGVRHVWVPIGSKITAQFVGSCLMKEWEYVLLIDDDMRLPANMPLETRRLEGKVGCVGYTITSVGGIGETGDEEGDGSDGGERKGYGRGTLWQQAQDVEYKLVGLNKCFQARWGSAIFPHGAISLWRREVLVEVIKSHPGFKISEDWYLGHTARCSGYRVLMASSVFVPTEAPPRLLYSPFGSKSRPGYGELTILSQRFYRWNFFFLRRIFTNIFYILFSWRLPLLLEVMTKLWVFKDTTDYLILFMSPFALPCLLAANWKLFLAATGILLAGMVGAVVFFNGVQLRGKGQQVRWTALGGFVVMKICMAPVNVGSVYWSLWSYGGFFAGRRVGVMENVGAWPVIRRGLGEEGGVVEEMGEKPEVVGVGEGSVDENVEGKGDKKVDESVDESADEMGGEKADGKVADKVQAKV